MDLNGSLVGRYTMDKLNVLHWDGLDSLDGHNLDYSLTSGNLSNWCLGRRSGRCWGGGTGRCWGRGWGRCWGRCWGGGLSGCWSGASSGGCWLVVLNSGITNNAVTFVVSDVRYNVLNTVSTGESRNRRTLINTILINPPR